MNTDDIKKIIKDGSKNEITNVKITTKSGKQFKQALRINSLNQLCIGNYKSKFPNYIISELTIENWDKVEAIK